MRDLANDGIPVKILCRKRKVLDTVFFLPAEVAGEVRIYREGFNGCNIGFCSCEECEACRDEAYEILRSFA